MEKKFAQYTLYDTVTPVAVTSSTDATPIVVTATAHGLSTGDMVLIYGHTTNVAANGIFKVTRLSSSTFSLQDRYTGADVAGSGAGAGSSGLLIANPKIILVRDFANIELEVETAGTATTTLKVAISSGKIPSSTSSEDTPNMGATVSKSNPYDFAQIVDLSNGQALNGATGIVVAGTDIAKSFEVNVNAAKYVCVFPVTWTQGSITIKLSAYSGR